MFLISALLKMYVDIYLNLLNAVPVILNVMKNLADIFRSFDALRMTSLCEQ